MMSTQTYTTSNPWETLFGYSRAIRRGNLILVSGTTSIDPTSGKIQHPGQAGLQTVAALQESIRAIEDLDGKVQNVVRVRMYVKRDEDCGEVGDGMQSMLAGKSGGWVATMIVGNRFVEEMLVEVEVEAVLG